MPAETYAEILKKSALAERCARGKHEFEEILRCSAEHSSAVAKWCPVCGAIEVDREVGRNVVTGGVRKATAAMCAELMPVSLALANALEKTRDAWTRAIAVADEKHQLYPGAITIAQESIRAQEEAKLACKKIPTPKTSK